MHAGLLFGAGVLALLAGVLYDIFDDKMMSELSDDVADTCRLVAGLRALESDRNDSIFANKDPLAKYLAGPKVMEKVTFELRSFFATPTPETLDGVPMRALALDDRIEEACNLAQETPIRQVVVIGAGMDTRAYRLQLPHVHWFEVDMPEVIARKEELLRTNVPDDLQGILKADNIKALSRVSLNLKDNLAGLVPALVENGFDSAAPAFFLMEGLIMYLSVNEVRSLFYTLPIVPGSRAVVTSVSYLMRKILNSFVLMDYIIDVGHNFKSHKIASLWRNDLVSLSLGKAFGPWKVVKTVNIALEQKEKRGISLTDINNPWLPIRYKKTVEYILDLVTVA